MLKCISYVDSVEYRYSVDKIVLSTAAILTFSNYIFPSHV